MWTAQCARALRVRALLFLPPPDGGLYPLGMRTRETPPYLLPERIALVGRAHAHGEIAAFGEIKLG